MPSPRASLTLVAALLAGCVAAPGPVSQPGQEATQAAARGGRVAQPPAPAPPTTEAPRVTVQPGQAPTGAGEVPDPGAAIGPQASGIIGKLKSPTGLVATNAGFGLSQAFRLLDLGQDPVAGATLTLVDADGAPVSAERATTGPDGSFRFEALPAGDAAFFVQAEFALAGAPVVLRAPAEPPDAGALEVEVDAASTLVAAKFRGLVRRGTLTKRPRALAKLAKLAARVRAALAPETVPFLGRASRDLVAAFDQLALDDAAVARLAADVAPAAAEPDDAWAVGPAVDAARLRELGVLTGAGTSPAPDGAEAEEAGFGADGGVFAADAEGALYVASDTAPVRIVRLAPDGTAADFATLPTDVLPPVSLAFAPAGELVAAGLDARRAMWICAGTGGVLTKRAGGPFVRTRDEDALASLGRIAVDRDGSVYVPVPKLHVVLAFAPGQALPRKVAGRWALPGHHDGPADEALFRFPYSLATGPDGAIYVADTKNACVRRIVPAATADAGRTVETVVGRPGEAFYRNGRGAFARVGRPTGVALDAAGNLYLTDAGSRRVRRVSPQGSVFLVAGTGEAGLDDGPGFRARFTAPSHLAAASDGTLFVHDLGTDAGGQPREAIRKLSPPTGPATAP